MSKKAAASLEQTINDLMAQRQVHVDAIADIDATFEKFGIAPGSAPAAAPAKSRKKPGPKPGAKRAGKKPGPKPGPKAGAKRAGKKPGPKPGAKRAAAAKAAPKPAATKKRAGRGNFTKTAPDSVLDFIKANPGCSTADVNKHWAKEGRKGVAGNCLTNLVKEGKVKRKSIKGQRGSTYSA